MLDSTISEIPFTAIDFESAGTAKGKTDAPIQIGTTCWNVIEGITDTWMSYIYTDQEITWSAQKIHHISKDMLVDSPKIQLLWPTIKTKLHNSTLVAHGHGTEKRFLRAFPGHNFGPWIDTLYLSRKLWPKLSDHKLQTVSEHLNLTSKIHTLVPNKSWHDALFDAAASMLILEAIIEMHSLSNKPLAILSNL